MIRETKDLSLSLFGDKDETYQTQGDDQSNYSRNDSVKQRDSVLEPMTFYSNRQNARLDLDNFNESFTSKQNKGRKNTSML